MKKIILGLIIGLILGYAWARIQWSNSDAELFEIISLQTEIIDTQNELLEEKYEGFSNWSNPRNLADDYRVLSF